MKQKLAFSSLLLTLSLASAPTARATTAWYVDGVNGSDSNNCQSSSTPCKTIGHATSLASSGDSMMVAAATYKENLNIIVSLTIVGSSAQTTIVDGGYVGTVVTVSSANAHVSLSNVTIQNGGAITGVCGGGINNAGTLTIYNTTIWGNRATLSCGGGGVYNVGTLAINNSTITGNVAYGNLFHPSRGGGGIRSLGTLTVTNSTISGNSVGWGSGGGVAADALTTVNNSTISGNSAYPNVGGGGIRGCCGIVKLQNSIVANNVAGNKSANCSGVTSNGYNTSSDNTCNFSNSGDRNNTDPLLGPLQYNGGPTQTMALEPGSPAIDAGNPSGCTDGAGHLLTTDQRGYPRHDPEDAGGCDMGAYERQTD
jgi:hypothetical protein